MCGIVGYIGDKQAKFILLDCLSRLEYRGYDSCGIAIRDADIKVYKDITRVADVAANAPVLSGKMGIGHTRWATHGIPSVVNAHPHVDCTGRFAVVHNGVIANYAVLKQQLIAEGHVFLSQTDTEVLPHLIEKYYDGNLETAVEAAVSDVEGTYAIIVICQDEEKLVVARKDSPLVIGIGDGENFIASDVPAFIHYTNKAIYLENESTAVITADSVTVRQHGKATCSETQSVQWCRENGNKDQYAHYMLKEIHEQPDVVAETLGKNVLLNLDSVLDNTAKTFSILACGTSYHAGLIGEYIIEELLGIPVRVTLASEFNHRRVMFPDEAIVVTQSGETADVLYAMKRLKSAGIKTLVVTNVPGSTASRLGEVTIYSKAGAEVSVAATKSFVAQLCALYQLALTHPAIDGQLRTRLIIELLNLPVDIEKVFESESQIKNCAQYVSKYENAFFIGRGVNYPVALEGALKLKEISYIHAEGYAAGELKHGPFALLYPGVPVIAIMCQDDNYDSMVTSIKEVKARDAYVIAVAEDNDHRIDGVADAVIRVPHTHYLLSPVVNTVALQLLSYYAAVNRGCPIDFPRNLAKSVTVE